METHGCIKRGLWSRPSSARWLTFSCSPISQLSFAHYQKEQSKAGRRWHLREALAPLWSVVSLIFQESVGSESPLASAVQCEGEPLALCLCYLPLLHTAEGASKSYIFILRGFWMGIWVLIDRERWAFSILNHSKRFLVIFQLSPVCVKLWTWFYHKDKAPVFPWIFEASQVHIQ